MSSYISLIVIVVLLVGLFLYTSRAKRRAADAATMQAESIVAGAEVMTTSGLYGRVVALNGDEESVQLRIADGIEVRWALAALRTVESLPDRYRGTPVDAAEPADPAAP